MPITMNADLLASAIVNGLMLASVYALVALGLTVVFGLLDIVNFAHGQILLLGAYVTFALVSHQVSFWVALVGAALVVTALGAALERVVFRPVERIPINGLLVSIGLIAIFRDLIRGVWGPDQKLLAPPITFVAHFGGVSVPASRLVVVAGTIVVLAGLSVFLYRTRAGKALRATAQNRTAAALMGIPTNRVNNLAFALGACLASIAGSFLAMQFPVEPALADTPLLMGFIVLILGGAGSPVGAVLGALVIGLTQSVAIAFGSSEAAQVIPFLLLAVILFVRPEGIVRVSSERWV
jgi:branched-chain amino acid transport system permease protein